MNYRQIYEKVMPESKRKEERYNLWVTVAVRPLSVMFTIPFIKSSITPIQITALSIVFSLLGFLCLGFGDSIQLRILGWLMFFFWAVLDGVDGNLARCTNRCSQLGDLWDTTGGYLAMVLMYFSGGLSAFYDYTASFKMDAYWMIIIGASTAIFSIFPRLVMHKKKSYGVESKGIKELSEKRTFGVKQILAMNIVSPSGFMQIILLISILFGKMVYFNLFYFIVNSIILIISMWKLLKD